MMQLKDPDSLELILREALPMLAGICFGFAELTDSEGAVLRAVDSEGEEIPVEGMPPNPLARQAAEEQTAVTGPSVREQLGEALAIPIGSYVLYASNQIRASRDKEVLESLKLALPLIAKAAGGEGVLFDREGRRLMSILPNGQQNPETDGVIFESCRRVMEAGRPDVSPSKSFPGALAVRIPLSRDFGFGFNNALTVQRGQQLLEEMNKTRAARYTWEDIVGDSEAIAEAVRVAKRAAATSSPVWIFAESGSGKELFAQAIHNDSARKNKPFVAVNCASIPPSLIESTLFGYVDGAFTGAKKGGQKGLFLQAEGGTLLLDEISELEITLQAKLLRVLQEREVTPIGSEKQIPIDVRIISTSNLDLRKLVEEGSFRKDLFYRLNVVDLSVPRLRDRKEDIPSLVQHFLSRLSFRNGKLISKVSREAMERLIAYDWPGNVRELENCIERAMAMAEGDVILARNLSAHVMHMGEDRGLTLQDQLREFEAEVIEKTIAECGGNKKQAAEKLGISFTTLWRRLQGTTQAQSDS